MTPLHTHISHPSIVEIVAGKVSIVKSSIRTPASRRDVISHSKVKQIIIEIHQIGATTNRPCPCSSNSSNSSSCSNNRNCSRDGGERGQLITLASYGVKFSAPYHHADNNIYAKRRAKLLLVMAKLHNHRRARARSRPIRCQAAAVAKTGKEAPKKSLSRPTCKPCSCGPISASSHHQ